MLRYFYGMRFRPGLVFPSFLALFAVLSGCGDEPGTTGAFVPSESQAASIELTGNISAGGESQSILVFAFARSGDDTSDEQVSLSVGIVDEQGEFTLSLPPAGKIGMTFLSDSTNDGAIDRGDPIAHLDDGDQQLDDLQSGDRVHIADIHLDFRRKRAVADSIEVARAGDAVAPESTPTPEQ